MFDFQVIDDPAAATVALEPMRVRLFSELAAPASAATLATRVGLARQKVNITCTAKIASEIGRSVTVVAVVGEIIVWQRGRAGRLLSGRSEPIHQPVSHRLIQLQQGTHYSTSVL